MPYYYSNELGGRERSRKRGKGEGEGGEKEVFS